MREPWCWYISWRIDGSFFVFFLFFSRFESVIMNWNLLMPKISFAWFICMVGLSEHFIMVRTSFYIYIPFQDHIHQYLIKELWKGQNQWESGWKSLRNPTRQFSYGSNTNPNPLIASTIMVEWLAPPYYTHVLRWMYVTSDWWNQSPKQGKKKSSLSHQFNPMNGNLSWFDIGTKNHGQPGRNKKMNLIKLLNSEVL